MQCSNILLDPINQKQSDKTDYKRLCKSLWPYQKTGRIRKREKDNWKLTLYLTFSLPGIDPSQYTKKYFNCPKRYPANAIVIQGRSPHHVRMDWALLRLKVNCGDFTWSCPMNSKMKGPFIIMDRCFFQFVKMLPDISICFYQASP